LFFKKQSFIIFLFMKQNLGINFTYGIEEAITPLDGRNRNKLQSLTPYFSELALNKYRVFVELQYLQKLSEYKVVRKLSAAEKKILDKIIKEFGLKDYRRIREIEKVVNHDLKAVEEYLKEKLLKTSLKDVAAMIHFGLTSDDTNNLAYALMIKSSLKDIIIPEIEKVAKELKEKSIAYKLIVMLGRTHGQAAIPTTVGKELAVYYQRLFSEFSVLASLQIKGKLTGNVGNLNVHKFIFPEIDWLKFSREFVSSLGLEPDLVTTQIEPYDSLIKIFQSLQRINNILLGLAKDAWIYIMLGYFKQKVIEKEVGSTALPHKINPIYFEGAEGGFGIANALFEFYCRKLSHSRLQRDLSDSTVKRSFSMAFAYSFLSYQSMLEALKRIETDKEVINGDLNNHWEILSEAFQNFLRVKGHVNAYDKTKHFFRGHKIGREDVAKFIKDLKLEKDDEKKLLALTPETYHGYAEDIVNEFLSLNKN
jgi:adenylosuccinate lyase